MSAKSNKIELSEEFMAIWRVEQTLWSVEQTLWRVEQTLWRVEQTLWRVEQTLWRVEQTLWDVMFPFFQDKNEKDKSLKRMSDKFQIFSD